MRIQAFVWVDLSGLICKESEWTVCQENKKLLSVSSIKKLKWLQFRRHNRLEMTNRLAVYQEHGDALCLIDGVFTITFCPQQLSSVEWEDGYTVKIRPSLVESKIDKAEFLNLKKYSANPSAQWLYQKARSGLSEFVSCDGDITSL